VPPDIFGQDAAWLVIGSDVDREISKDEVKYGIKRCLQKNILVALLNSDGNK
jgi:hypothetical protein